MAASDISSLLDAMAGNIAGYDYQANRARTEHGNRLKELAAIGMNRRKQLSDGLASQGMVHSGVNLQAQTELNTMMDTERAKAEQSLGDRLANLARQRIREEAAFNINSLLPR